MSAYIATARRGSAHEISPVSETTPDSSPGPSPKRHCLQGPPPYSAIDAAAAIGGLAARACEKCRASKRKCDKRLPFCDRCKRLNAKCQYVHDISSSANPHGAQFVIYQPRPLTHDPLLRAPEPLDGISAAQLLSLVPAGAGAGHPPVDWRAAVTNYFFCVHPWFAVVHPAVFERQAAALVASLASGSPPGDSYNNAINNNSNNNNNNNYTPPSVPNSRSNSTSTASRRDSVAGLNLTPSFADALTTACQQQQQQQPKTTTTTSTDWSSKTVALLVLAMYLNTRMRLTVDAGEQPIFDATYRTVKRLLSPLLLGCVGDPRPSVELVQAGALLALYEYGHGEIVTAYRTLSQAVVTARVMDIKPGQIADGVDDDALMLSVEEEQMGCLWWGMFILEQSIHQDEDAKDLPFLLETPTRNTLLPETPPMTPPPDGRNFPVSPPSSTTATTVTRHLSTSVLVSSEKFGGFQLSAKAATLFHRAIRIDKERDERPGKMPLVAAYADLDREIRETTLTLLNNTLDWEGVLDCFAMLVSALFILYLPYLAVLESSCSSGMDVEMGMGDLPLPAPPETLHSYSSESSSESAEFSGASSSSAAAGATIDGIPGSHSGSRSGSGAGIGVETGSSSPADAILRSNPELDTAVMALRFACKMSTDISCKLNADYGANPKSPAQLCAPAGATCYLVILAFASLGRIFPDNRAECQENIAEKFESLTLFSFRWGIAEKMMSQLEKKIGVDRRQYLKGSKIRPPTYAVAFDFGRQ
ncbi:uncharacterized protein F4807DRAFT_394021 [Annulohypoxylon truncatum]|uniref:uncharacterized protein n=1 Tax=Annulohypoxylon truncatum TaxID=327061 RepID=UPI0020078B86|nr:uncharacterized protein F4807DRAFT_394021 [Annulohypoxylon truncatum]KAI1211556.1 hypothetical protein F4807DRAFT_394021 [Annulohypoxylon truncatum]